MLLARGLIEITVGNLYILYTRSGARSLVAKMLLHKSRSSRSSAASALFLDLSPSPTTANRGGRRRGSGVNSSRNRKQLATAGHRRSEGGLSDDDGIDDDVDDGDLTDSDHDDPTAAAAAGFGVVVRRDELSSGEGGGELGTGGAAAGDGIGSGHGFGGDGSDSKRIDEEGEEEEGTCDIFLEAVSTGGLQEELLGHHAFEVGTAFMHRELGNFAYCFVYWLLSLPFAMTKCGGATAKSKLAPNPNSVAAEPSL